MQFSVRVVANHDNSCLRDVKRTGNFIEGKNNLKF